MKNYIKSVAMIGFLSISQLAYPDSITDTYNTGDTLTATTLNNIKSAVNDNDARTTTLENSQTLQDTDIGNLNAGQQALQTNDSNQDTRLDALEAADLINRITALESAPKANIAATAPTVNDDVNSGVTIGSVWIDITEKEAYILVDNAAGAAVWKRVSNNYAIGDTGPAGGIVFYVSDNGLHGLEAAPVNLGLTGWGCQGTVTGASGTAVGTGAQNTSDILANCAESGIAADLASTYSISGESGWHLPSIGELKLLYFAAYVSGFDPSAIQTYWTSTENSLNSARVLDIRDGTERSVDKNGLHGVRPIRAF
jgi:hypothetical protein